MTLTDMLDQLKDDIAQADDVERRRRREWDADLPKLYVTGHRGGMCDWITVELGLTQDGSQKLAFRVPREAWGDHRLEPGAVRTLVPGFREPGYTERMQAARKALLGVNGDLDRIGDDHRALIADSNLPF